MEASKLKQMNTSPDGAPIYRIYSDGGVWRVYRRGDDRPVGKIFDDTKAAAGYIIDALCMNQ